MSPGKSFSWGTCSISIGAMVMRGADTFPVRDFHGNDYGIFQSITVTFQFVAEKTEMDGVTTDLMWRDKGRGYPIP